MEANAVDPELPHPRCDLAGRVMRREIGRKAEIHAKNAESLGPGVKVPVPGDDRPVPPGWRLDRFRDVDRARAGVVPGKDEWKQSSGSTFLLGERGSAIRKYDQADRG
jgi:hypothetical protein